MHAYINAKELILQGCISVSMSLHQTTFCFVCSHLASGEKEGDELKRNADVAEILKNTQFPKICKNIIRPIPERIVDHEYVLAHLIISIKICFHFPFFYLSNISPYLLYCFCSLALKIAVV